MVPNRGEGHEPLGVRRALRGLTPPPETGSTIGDRYRVYGKSSGGIGDVYFVVDTVNNQPLAMKTPRPRSGVTPEKLTSLYRRFEGEVEVWAALGNHPNVVRCHYLTLIDGVPYVVLEWVAERGRPNVSLGAYVRDKGPRSALETLEIAIDVTRGLLHAQAIQPGFVHRDLKPDNVLLTQQGVAKVTDFGFAQFEPRPLPGGGSPYRSRAIVGTPRYMAPEQWERGIVDERADVYAMGSILYEMFSGQHLFEVHTRPAWRDAHIKLPPPHLSDELPGWADALVQRCLAKDPAQRFPTIAELQDRLETLLREEFGAQPRPIPSPDALAAEELNNLGNTHCYLGHYDLALDEYDHALSLQPDLAAARYGRGIVFNALGQHEDAVREYTTALALEPEHAAARFNRANTLVTLGCVDRALDDFAAAVQSPLTSASALHNRGLLHLDAGRMAEARADFDAAIAAGPSVAALRSRANVHLMEGRTADAVDDLSAIIEAGSDTELDDRIARARLLMKLGEHRRAAQDYNAAIDAGAGPGIFAERARSMAALGKHVTAVADLTLALRDAANPAAILRDRAASLHALGRDDEAIADYAQITELDPGDTDAYYEMGLLLGMRGQSREALALLDEAARRGHESAETALRRFGYRPSVPASPSARHTGGKQ